MNNLAFDATKASKMGLDAIRHKCLTNITSLHFTVNKQNTFLQELDEVLFGGPNRDYPKLSMLSIDGSRTYITKHIHSINDLFKFGEIDEIKLSNFLISTESDFENLLKGAH